MIDIMLKYGLVAGTHILQLRDDEGFNAFIELYHQFQSDLKHYEFGVQAPTSIIHVVQFHRH